jgi:hypothetical protein
LLFSWRAKISNKGAKEEAVKETMICLECGSLNLEIYDHPATGASADPKLPDAIRKYTYECQNCGHEFTENELYKYE